jgi:hypothetical protein
MLRTRMNTARNVAYPPKTTRHLNAQIHKENEVNNACNKDFYKRKHIL